MRVSLFLLAAVSTVSAGIFSSSEPKIEGTATWPESNPFGHVVNGEKNKISVLVENKSDQEISLKSVSGSFHVAESGKFIRNTTSLGYDSSLLPGAKISIPYIVNSELKPQDTRLRLFVDYTASNEKYRLTAFDSVVSIKEPKGSWFDPQLILTYLMLAGIFASGGYFAYVTYFPQRKVKAVPKPSAPVTVTATTTSGYQEEWIPEHHLKTRKSARGAASSGDESGPERKSKGKKRN